MEPDYDRRLARERLTIVDAVAMVINRRMEFMQLVADSDSAEAAALRLQTEWGLSKAQAVAALDLQMRRFAELERTRITDERDDLVRRADELDG